MKKLLLWLLLLASFTADAQFIGGGPRKVSSAAPDLSGYAIKAANNLFSGKNIFSDSTTFEKRASFTGPWSDYTVRFGRLSEGGRISFINGSTGNIGARIGYNSSTSSDFTIEGFLNAQLQASGSVGQATVRSTGASGVVQLTASGTAAGQIRMQTGSTESARNFTNGNWRFGSTGIDNGSRVQVEGTADIAGQLTTQDIVPDGNTSRAIGSVSSRYNIIYSNNYLNTSTTVLGTTSGGNALLFRIGASGNHVGGFFGSSGRMFIQPAGTTPTDNGTDQLQVYGSGFFSSGLSVGGSIIPLSDNTYSLGGSAFRYNIAYLGNIIFGSTGRVFQISQTGASNVVFKVQPTTGNITIQSPDSSPTDRGYTLDVQGNMGLDGTLTIKDGTITKTVGGGYNFDAALGTSSTIVASSVITSSTTIRGIQGVTAGANSAPDASSILEARSTSKGFLPPRMTETQRDAISSPAEGLMIYQTNGTKGWYGYDGSAWVKIN